MGFSVFGFRDKNKDERSQDVPDQDQAGQEAQAKPSHPPVDQDEDWQHHQVQRQEETLEEDQAQVVNPVLSPRAPDEADFDGSRLSPLPIKILRMLLEKKEFPEYKFGFRS